MDELTPPTIGGAGIPRASTPPNDTATIQRMNVKGRKGRPRGSENREKIRIRQWCQRVLENPEFLEKFEEALLEFDPDTIKKLMPLIMRAYDYAYGRPKYTIALEAKETPPPRLVGRPEAEIVELYELERRRREILSADVVDAETTPALPAGEEV